MTYLIYVDGLLHNMTSRKDDHEAYAARLTEAGYDVTTEVRNVPVQGCGNSRG